MSSLLQKIIKKGFKQVGIDLSSEVDVKKFEQVISSLDRISFMLAKNVSEDPAFDFLRFASDKLTISHAQLFQDLFVLYTLNEKQNGFFVEFGATNGISLSNTYLLEQKYQWTGIVAEPGKGWHHELRQNRKCIIDDRCVWTSTGQELVFFETEIAELSTIKDYAETDYFSKERSERTEYRVKTISLNDLLETNNAPRVIDYLSIDTEGSEFEILNAFDFSKYKFAVITVEHNFSSMRSNIFDLLTANGYKRTLEKISAFDDWYIFAG
ncbi:FkbM family methyltransferase [Flavitalea sp.]|nr:FkbM family methyltransferase [Flavitalea sp.]